MKIFIENPKGYTESHKGVVRAKIMKLENQKVLKVEFIDPRENFFIPMVYIKMFFLINEETLEEYFRYEK